MLYSVIHVAYDLHKMYSRQLKMTDDRLHYSNGVQPRKIKQHKIQQNKTTLVQWTFTTLGQETRWAYSTAPEPTRGFQPTKYAAT